MKFLTHFLFKWKLFTTVFHVVLFSLQTETKNFLNVSLFSELGQYSAIQIYRNLDHKARTKSDWVVSHGFAGGLRCSFTADFSNSRFLVSALEAQEIGIPLQFVCGVDAFWPLFSPDFIEFHFWLSSTNIYTALNISSKLEKPYN